MLLRYRFLLLPALVYGLTTGCSSSGKTTRKAAVRVAPGLDAQTMVVAAQVADSNFVNANREQKAADLALTGKETLDRFDRFWSVLETENKNSGGLSAADKERFDRAFKQGAETFARWKKLTNNGADEKAAREAMNLCLEAQMQFEEALRINPFDKNTRVVLAVVYYNLQSNFGVEKNHEKAVLILERLIRLEKGEHNLYRLLGENYLALKEYDRALSNFQLAREVVLETGFMAKPDTAMLYYYTYIQGDVYARLYNDQNALTAFNDALPYARAAQEKADVKNYVKWINWDGGNLRASEQWDRVLELEQAKAYPQLAAACAGLLSQLRTRNAKFEVLHKLSVVEFEFLRKKEQAVESMRMVFDNIPLKTDGTPQDTSMQAYLNTYGAMLYRLGIEAKAREQKKLSLAYHTKATSFYWNQISKSCLEMMALLWNTPEKAITYGKRALVYGNSLSSNEVCELNSLMSKAYKSAGRFNEARMFFSEWKKCNGKFTANDARAKND